MQKIYLLEPKSCGAKGVTKDALFRKLRFFLNIYK